MAAGAACLTDVGACMHACMHAPTDVHACTPASCEGHVRRQACERRAAAVGWRVPIRLISQVLRSIYLSDFRIAGHCPRGLACGSPSTNDGLEQGRLRELASFQGQNGGCHRVELQLAAASCKQPTTTQAAGRVKEEEGRGQDSSTWLAAERRRGSSSDQHHASWRAPCAAELSAPCCCGLGAG